MVKKFDEYINESVKDLMKGKSDEDILKEISRLTPYQLLIKSCDNGYLNGVKISLERGADPSYKNNYVIGYASYKGHTNIVKLLLNDRRVDPSAGDNSAIRNASENGHTDIVKILLNDKRVDPSERDNSAIRYASQNGYLEIVELLLNDNRVRNKLSDREIEKYENQKRGLNESIKDLMKPKSEDEIKEIVKTFPSNKKISYAIDNDLLWLAEEAIKEGLSDYYLWFFMNSAIANDNLDMVKLFVDNGAEIGNSNLVTAIKNNKKEIVKYLLEQGESLDVEVDDEDDSNLFMNIIDKNDIEMVKMIVDAKCGFYLDENWLDDFIENSDKHSEMLKILMNVYNVKERVKHLHDHYQKIAKQLDKYV